MDFSLFLSHSSKDRALANKIADSTSLVGAHTYLFERDPQPGTYVAKKIETRIRACDVFSVLLTKQGYRSAYIQQEIGLAVGAKKLVLPVMEHGYPTDDLALLIGKEYVPFDPSNPHNAIEVLSSYIARLRGNKENRQALGALILAIGVAGVVVYLASKSK